jgi:thiamine transport system ATP-binding protein
MLRIRDLVVAYQGQDILHGIDLDVPGGQLLCVLGPSGGGKSTLLRAIAGLEEPRAGSIVLGGRDLAGIAAHERGVGLMFQDYALFPHRDVGGNVAFGLRMQGVATAVARARVSELLDLVGLPGAERRPVSQLSGGEQQRVALARALAPRPRLLMLDEPMGSLDRALRERLPEELRAIFSDLGLTTLYVTHDQDEALSVADRVVILDAGRIAADGTPEALWSRPPGAWVARFLGFRNVAAGRLERGRLVTPWGSLPGEAIDGKHAAKADPAGGDAVAVSVMLRAAGLATVADGPIHGLVVGRRFGGDHVLFTVQVPGAPDLQVEARGGDWPAVGQAITLRPLPESVHLMPASGSVAEAPGVGTTAAPPAASPRASGPPPASRAPGPS